MRKMLRLGCGVLISISLIFLIGSGSYLLYLDTWYKQLRAELPEINRKLALLNHATLSQIPPPSGVTQGKVEDSLGMNSSYGVKTRVKYRVTKAAPNIQDYYLSVMAPLGWAMANSYQDDQGFSSRDYYRDDTCVIIKVFKKDEEFTILIFHDFQDQDFSPKLPPRWYMAIREYGETTVDACPYHGIKIPEEQK